jgi:hypothetical protein
MTIETGMIALIDLTHLLSVSVADGANLGAGAAQAAA